MCGEMGLTPLQQVLKSLCFNSEWKYAVYWKLNHRARTMLTWNDAYYNNQEALDPSHKYLDTPKNSHEDHCLRDPLGLAVAKMSYIVYALGEGIVGQVAVSGTHQWIFADKPTSNIRSSSEFCDGWQTQFSAGIRTVAVIPVSPHGVVQLGSLNKVIEDMKLVIHIKNVFYLLQNSSMDFMTNPTNYTMQRTQYLESTKAFSQETCTDVLHSSERNRNEDILSHFSSGLYNYSSPSTGVDQKSAAEVGCKKNSGDINTCWSDTLVSSKRTENPTAYNFHRDELKDTCLDNYFALPVEKSRVDYPSPMDLYSTILGRVDFDRVTYPQNEELLLPKPSKLQLGRSFEQISDCQTEVSCIDTMDSLRFSSCSELYEALGPIYKKDQDLCALGESAETKTALQSQPPERTYNEHQFTTECESSQLLEAVVANTRPFSRKAVSEGGFRKSAESMLTTGKTLTFLPKYSKNNGCGPNGSAVGPSILFAENVDDDSLLITGSAKKFTLRSPNESSSKTPSTSSKQSEMQSEPAKINRKKNKPGESTRPRPRDRQLIQDRVKELREIIPNSSKCSIDSLLERTIKHMLFLQSVTKHEDKLKICAATNLRGKRIGVEGSSNQEYGSSCALEVGNETQGCPIVVENLSTNGQMLVEMLCEDYRGFLEIAEAVRRLGLMILRGMTEVHGEKTWACFIVEGQNNRNMQRMDIVWSLMQLLQPKTTF